MSEGRRAHAYETALGAVSGFRIEDEQSDATAAVFSVHGELDLHEAPALEERISAAIARGANVVVIDLTDVTFIDSMALGVLLGAVKELRVRGGDLRLVVPNRGLRRIFEISLLDQVFTLDSSREEATPSADPPADAPA